MKMLESTIDRRWYIPSMNVVNRIVITAMFALLSTPAFAQRYGGGVFAEAGGWLWELYCDFTHSPILAFVVIVILVSLLIGMGSGEENGLIGKFMKFGIMAVLILTAPAIAEQMNYSIIPC